MLPRLRPLFVFSAAFVALPFCSVARADVTQAEQDAITAMRRVWTNLQTNRDGTVRLVRLSKPAVTDDSLTHLQHFKHIDYLAVICPQVTDAGLANIASLTNLDTLLLSQTQVTDEGLRLVEGLKKLERLYLDKTGISDDGLAHLKSLPALRILSLRDTKISDEGIKQLADLKQLDTLFLCDTDISDASLAFLSSLEKLQTLYLARTKIDGSGLTYLSKLKHLKHLSLSGTAISADSIASLASAETLTELLLYDTPVDLSSIDRLKVSLPKLAGFGVALSTRHTTLPNNRPKDSNEPPTLKTEQIPAKVRFTSESNEVPDFQRHVIPLLGRLGCNGRACHGSFQGQGGFRLSMFGYDFEMDHENLTKGEQPRINVESPENSLILNKPTSADEHEGGLRYEKDGWEYQLLRRWIKGGAKQRPDDAAVFVRLDVTPPEIVFQEEGEETQLTAIAVWSDGSREDVTCLARFESNDDAIADVAADGLVHATGKGDTHVIVFYDNGITPVPTMTPFLRFSDKEYPEVPTPTKVDELVVAKLSKLGIVPSELSTDEDFLRRISLDLIGTLPTPDEILAFIEDQSSDKRTKKIDELLEHTAYVTWWTTRLCDLTGSNAGYLGGTEMAQPVAAQWRAWLERRVRDNIGWDKIASGIILARSRPAGQTYEDFIAAQSRFTSRENPADFTALDNPMPHYWYRDNMRMPEEKALAFGYTFLGVRLQCAQCHKHPYDQWSKQDFEHFTEFFTRIKTGVQPDAKESYEQMREMLGVPVKLNSAALRRQSYLRIAAEGKPIPWGEVFVSPPTESPHMGKLLGSAELDLAKFDDPREPLMQWLLDKDNLYFARAFVNRIWANYFNVGIIDPPDDLNLANPPSNRELLDYLAEQFVVSGFDMKWLHRTITRSRIYQLSWKPNDSNRSDQRNFSHAIVRRLPAEVAIDAILHSTASEKKLATVDSDVKNRKIGQHPKSYQARAIDFSLLIFGKPLRTTNCDCERSGNPTLLQALYVRNDSELLETLQRKDGWLAQLSGELQETLSSEVTGQADLVPKSKNEKASVGAGKIEQFVRTAYLRTLSRRPNDDELRHCRQHILASKNTVEGLRDVMWALLNSQEFITNH